MPKKEHTVQHKERNGRQCRVSKAKRIGQVIHVKETKQQEEYSWKKGHALPTSKTYNNQKKKYMGVRKSE
jgi:hypothetical protein